MSARPIETRYAGCRFRSRLEARWAVFFDRLETPWIYEPQGFMVSGRPYLPDFLLPATGTWVEVKGDEAELDHDLMQAAAVQLSRAGHGPDLLILGPMPDAADSGEWAWLGFTAEVPDMALPDEVVAFDGWWSFASAGALVAARETSCAPPAMAGYPDGWLEPVVNMIPNPNPAVAAAYVAARSARFEYGEKG